MVPMSQSSHPNRRGELKIWHFTCVLTPTAGITPFFTWYAHESQCIDKVTGLIAELRNWIEKLVSSVNKPDSISFTSLRFSRTADVATWMTHATARIPLQDIHFEGYIQSKTAIALHRLHRWIPDAIWNNVGGILSQNAEYKLLWASNPVYEHCNVGSPSVNKGGRPKRSKPSVLPGRCIRMLISCLICPLHTVMFFTILMRISAC